MPSYPQQKYQPIRGKMFGQNRSGRITSLQKGPKYSLISLRFFRELVNAEVAEMGKRIQNWI